MSTTTLLPRPPAKTADATKAATLLTAAELDLLTVLNAVKKAIGNIPKTTGMAENAAAERVLHQVYKPLLSASLNALSDLDRVRAAVLNR